MISSSGASQQSLEDANKQYPPAACRVSLSQLHVNLEVISAQPLDHRSCTHIHRRCKFFFKGEYPATQLVSG